MMTSATLYRYRGLWYLTFEYITIPDEVNLSLEVFMEDDIMDIYNLDMIITKRKPSLYLPLKFDKYYIIPYLSDEYSYE